jgi:hypothetical protein
MATWTDKQIKELKEIYLVKEKPELEKHFDKKWPAIAAKALSLGLSRRGKASAKSTKPKKPGHWGSDVHQLQKMIDDRADAKELERELRRPFEDIMAEAKKLDMDCGYLEGGGSSSSLALPFEKEIKSRLGLVLDLDVRVNIRSFRVEMGNG